jgi:uncharacterized protein with von Willebrand factor type A (vWA) domain
MTDVSGDLIRTQIRDLENREAEARVRADAVMLDTLWSDRLIVNSTSNLLLNKAQNLALLQLEVFRTNYYHRDTLKITLDGETAIATGNETTVLVGGVFAGSRVFYSYMNVWNKHAEDWKLVGRFVGMISRTPAEEAPAN